jgi:predicted alpha/beta hydrolase family esterase
LDGEFVTNVFIFHGTGGHPEENWFPWLKKELEKRGCRVFISQFPTPTNQTPESWFDVLEGYNAHFNTHTVFIGHSLGGAFLLRVLERTNVRVKASFFVAVPIGVLPIKNYEGDKPFIGHPFDWVSIREKCEKFFVFHSDNDPYVSLGNGEELAKRLATELTFVPGCGHFNKTAGFDKFDLLLEKIKTTL